MIRRPPRSTLFPYRRSSDLRDPQAHDVCPLGQDGDVLAHPDRKSTRLNSSHVEISYAVFCLKKNTPVLPVEVELDFAWVFACPCEELVAPGELGVLRHGEVDFFFNDPAAAEIYPLPLRDALPI